MAGGGDERTAGAARNTQSADPGMQNIDSADGTQAASKPTTWKRKMPNNRSKIGRYTRGKKKKGSPAERGDNAPALAAVGLADANVVAEVLLQGGERLPDPPEVPTARIDGLGIAGDGSGVPLANSGTGVEFFRRQADMHCEFVCVVLAFAFFMLHF